MSHSRHILMNFVLIALILFGSRQVLCKPGIDTVRRQYGLSGLLDRNESVVGEVSNPNSDDPSSRHATDYDNILKHRRIFEQDTDVFKQDMDYEFYDEAMGRSLFPVDTVDVKPIPPEMPSLNSFGKCYVEVLTSSLVQPNTRISVGNGSNPSVSIVETCCVGYEPYVHDMTQCVAVCKQPCINAICLLPNVCECFPDHVRSLNGDCIPTCPIFCLNGHCHWNGSCTCFPGYTLESNGKYCVPQCNASCGEFSNCTAPNTCTCLANHKYNFVERRCEPICQNPCGNGRCITPGACSCFPGFTLMNGTCQANCSRGCDRGRCVANDICACDSGWTLDQTGAKCHPLCQTGCPNGKCTAPAECTCSQGFIKDKNECIPHCPRGCRFGTCTAPNMCTCKRGYYLHSLGNYCKRVPEGNDRGQSQSSKPIFNPVVVVKPAPPAPIFNPTIKILPQSFVFNTSKNNRIEPPHQNNPLFNPTLLATPEKSSMRLSPTQTIKPSRSPSVTEKILAKQVISRPLFKPPVIVKPSAPEIPGKMPSIYDRQPAFNPFFQNSHLTSPTHSSVGKPNYLERQPAFNPNYLTIKTTRKTSTTARTTIAPRRIRTTSNSHPTKSKHHVRGKHHENITTSKPEKSFFLFNIFKSPKNSTDTQKTFRTTTLSPSCDRACLNGKCTGRNRCTCNRGYTMEDIPLLWRSKYRCFPYCSKGCPNGNCIAPEICTCRIGYKKKNGRCIKG